MMMPLAGGLPVVCLLCAAFQLRDGVRARSWHSSARPELGPSLYLFTKFVRVVPVLAQMINIGELKAS